MTARTLYDSMLNADSVTGKARGYYTDPETALYYVTSNFDLMYEANMHLGGLIDPETYFTEDSAPFVLDFNSEGEVILSKSNAVKADIMIRCFLLKYALIDTLVNESKNP